MKNTEKKENMPKMPERHPRDYLISKFIRLKYKPNPRYFLPLLQPSKQPALLGQQQME